MGLKISFNGKVFAEIKNVGLSNITYLLDQEIEKFKDENPEFHHVPLEIELNIDVKKSDEQVVTYG